MWWECVISPYSQSPQHPAYIFTVCPTFQFKARSSNYGPWATIFVDKVVLEYPHSFIYISSLLPHCKSRVAVTDTILPANLKAGTSYPFTEKSCRCSNQNVGANTWSWTRDVPKLMPPLSRTLKENSACFQGSFIKSEKGSIRNSA